MGLTAVQEWSICWRGQAACFRRAAAVTSRHASSHMLTCPLCLPIWPCFNFGQTHCSAGLQAPEAPCPCSPSHADVSIPGLMPGQIATPVRLGRARQGIFNPGVAELAGLDAERIVQVHNFCLFVVYSTAPHHQRAGAKCLPHRRALRCPPSLRQLVCGPASADCAWARRPVDGRSRVPVPLLSSLHVTRPPLPHAAALCRPLHERRRHRCGRGVDVWRRLQWRAGHGCQLEPRRSAGGGNPGSGVLIRLHWGVSLLGTGITLSFGAPRRGEGILSVLMQLRLHGWGLTAWCCWVGR